MLKKQWTATGKDHNNDISPSDTELALPECSSLKRTDPSSTTHPTSCSGADFGQHKTFHSSQKTVTMAGESVSVAGSFEKQLVNSVGDCGLDGCSAVSNSDTTKLTSASARTCCDNSPRETSESLEDECPLTQRRPKRKAAESAQWLLETLRFNCNHSYIVEPEDTKSDHPSTQVQKKRYHVEKALPQRRVHSSERNSVEKSLERGQSHVQASRPLAKKKSHSEQTEACTTDHDRQNHADTAGDTNSGRHGVSRVLSSSSALLNGLPTCTGKTASTVSKGEERASARSRCSGSSKGHLSSSRASGVTEPADDLQLVLLQHIEQRIDDLEKSARCVKSHKPSIEGLQQRHTDLASELEIQWNVHSAERQHFLRQYGSMATSQWRPEDVKKGQWLGNRVKLLAQLIKRCRNVKSELKRKLTMLIDTEGLCNTVTNTHPDTVQANSATATLTSTVPENHHSTSLSIPVATLSEITASSRHQMTSLLAITDTPMPSGVSSCVRQAPCYQASSQTSNSSNNHKAATPHVPAHGPPARAREPLTCSGNSSAAMEMLVGRQNSCIALQQQPTAQGNSDKAEQPSLNKKQSCSVTVDANTAKLLHKRNSRATQSRSTNSNNQCQLSSPKATPPTADKCNKSNLSHTNVVSNACESQQTNSATNKNDKEDLTSNGSCRSDADMAPASLGDKINDTPDTSAQNSVEELVCATKAVSRSENHIQTAKHSHPVIIKKTSAIGSSAQVNTVTDMVVEADNCGSKSFSSDKDCEAHDSDAFNDIASVFVDMDQHHNSQVSNRAGESQIIEDSQLEISHDSGLGKLPNTEVADATNMQHAERAPSTNNGVPMHMPASAETCTTNQNLQGGDTQMNTGPPQLPAVAWPSLANLIEAKLLEAGKDVLSFTISTSGGKRTFTASLSGNGEIVCAGGECFTNLRLWCTVCQTAACGTTSSSRVFKQARAWKMVKYKGKSLDSFLLCYRQLSACQAVTGSCPVMQNSSTVSHCQQESGSGSLGKPTKTSTNAVHLSDGKAVGKTSSSVANTGDFHNVHYANSLECPVAMERVDNSQQTFHTLLWPTAEQLSKCVVHLIQNEEFSPAAHRWYPFDSALFWEHSSTLLSEGHAS